MASICMLTPTHARDLPQFALLRRSVNAFAPDFPHIAIVNTEDYSLFRERFAAEPRLEIVRSKEVLPRAVEWARRRSGPRWRAELGRVLGRSIKGWHAQQLIKLYALADLEYEAAAFFDSDVFICRPLEPGYFYIGDRLKLYRRRAPNAELMHFAIASHEVLGNPLEQITELYDYIFSPSCFRRSTGQRLFEEFRRRHRERSWVRRFVAQRRPSEYQLLGYTATELEHGAGYALVECEPHDLHHSVRYETDREHLAAELRRLREQPKDFALFQSRLNLSLDDIEAAFDEMLAATAPAAAARHRGH